MIKNNVITVTVERFRNDDDIIDDDRRSNIL